MLQETQYCEAIQLSSTLACEYHYPGEASTLPSLSSALLENPRVFNNSSGASIPAKPHISRMRGMKLDAATDNRAGGEGRAVNTGKLVLETATGAANQSKYQLYQAWPRLPRLNTVKLPIGHRMKATTSVRGSRRVGGGASGEPKVL